MWKDLPWNCLHNKLYVCLYFDGRFSETILTCIETPVIRIFSLFNSTKNNIAIGSGARRLIAVEHSSWLFPRGLNSFESKYVEEKWHGECDRECKFRPGTISRKFMES